ncbi:hypothetical protein N7532_007549 [Penicillium argentinense]|uniref:DUF6536 domain-containing protein n=1 Tax=Penicillium argentinense TaxID=1131581 RepID=A0A9W9F7Y9_9EURO|nr:uncharacterized protein N7532_007549 [Penicillium argentinense]KAJ5095258.1 hypothetical protein N7532_007549 [Penicillium argentinense]
MDNYGVGQLWNHISSIFSRKRYQGVSSPDQYDSDQAELVGAPASVRTKSSTFSLSSFSSFSTLRQSTFDRKSSLAQPALLGEDTDITLLESGAGAGCPPRQSESKDNFSPIHRKKQWIDGVYMCARAGTVVFILNLIFIGIAAGLASRYPDNRSFASSAVIYRGNCGISKRWDIAMHLIINVLSTCILAASNYCMQTLVAPTRKEVDAYHAKWKCLDIGSASVKNLFAIGKGRLALWITLMFTATPFHLMYNSIVFESLSTNEFGVMVGPKDLNSSNIHSLTTPALKKCFTLPAAYYGLDAADLYEGVLRELTWEMFVDNIANGSYHYIPLSQCIEMSKKPSTGVKGIVALAENLTVSDGGDASILMTEVAHTSPTSHDDPFQNQRMPATFYSNRTTSTENNATCLGYETVYNNRVLIDGTAQVRPGLGVSIYPISECLVIEAEEHCQLLFSPPICLVVMLAAFAKVSAMYLAAYIGRNRDPPLLTIGDAVASFMERPDPTTKGLCWMTGADVNKGRWVSVTRSGFQAALQNEQVAEPATFRRLKKRKHWMRAASGWRWAATLFMCFSCIITGICLFMVSSAGTGTSQNEWWSTSTFKNWFSEDVDISSYNIIYSNVPWTMLSAVVVANVPQLIVTMSYYCYNAVLTSMLATGEYSSYGEKRKALRVTWPVKGSQQRSTYWLSVPYRYATPILILYMLLHWLISQSIFYLLLIPYNPLDRADNSNTISSMGYSSMSIFLSIVVGSTMVLIMLVLAFRKCKSIMPLAGSSSAAISAACHLPKDECRETAALGLVQWGETPSAAAWMGMDDVEGIDDGQKGHCSFTSRETVKPSLMKLYA